MLSSLARAQAKYLTKSDRFIPQLHRYDSKIKVLCSSNYRIKAWQLSLTAGRALTPLLALSP